MNGTIIIDREELRRQLIALSDTHGRFYNVTEYGLNHLNLWKSLVAYSSDDAPSAMERIMEVLLRADPHCVVCGRRCTRDRGDSKHRVFGFHMYCSKKCSGIAQRGNARNSDKNPMPAPIHEIYGTDWVQAYRDAVRDGTEFEYEKTYRKALSAAIKKYASGYSSSHRDKLKSYMVTYNLSRTDKSASYREAHKADIAAYRAAHKARSHAYAKRYQVEHADVVLELGAKRRATKLSATPPWLSSSMKMQFRKIYATANAMSKRDGIKYHVDHIVPLKNKYVCGLHVPWNLQIITATENCTKRNKLFSVDKITEYAEHMKTIMDSVL